MVVVMQIDEHALDQFCNSFDTRISVALVVIKKSHFSVIVISVGSVNKVRQYCERAPSVLR